MMATIMHTLLDVGKMRLDSTVPREVSQLVHAGEPIDQLQPRGILVDGTTEGDEPRLLLQIFSANMIGPTFFEFIQRKDDEGFGEGNFKALFESIERDQVARGVVGA